MEREIVFVITTFNYNTKTTDLYGKAFKYKGEAIDFIEKNFLNDEEIEKNKKAKMRGLMTENEFIGKNKAYNIHLLEIYK